MDKDKDRGGVRRNIKFWIDIVECHRRNNQKDEEYFGGMYPGFGREESFSSSILL